MRIIKKVLSFALITAMAVTMTACGGSSKESKNDNKIVIRYQKSIAYAPVMIMAEKNMISKYYDKDLEVDCQVEKDGNTIKEGVSSGSIDIGTLGLPPAVVGILSGSKYKIFSGISSQASGFDGIKSGSIKAHIVISPYNFKELAVEGTHEIAISEDVWVPGDTSIVGIASKNLYENNKDLYNAVCKALDEAMQYVKNNPEETAQLVKDKLELDDSVEDIVKWMSDSKSQYSTTLQGVGNFVQFMQDEGFLENEYSGNLSDIVYDGVKGK